MDPKTKPILTKLIQQSKSDDMIVLQVVATDPKSRGTVLKELEAFLVKTGNKDVVITAIRK